MGAWGITVRQSDDGSDLLDTIVAEQLRKVNFAAFNVSEAVTLLKQNIQEEIEQYKQKPPSKSTDFYINEVLMHDFTNAAILIAEIKNFIVTKTDLQPLLVELENVQTPDHWKYQGWASEEILKQWLLHIQSVYQTLKEHT